MRIKTQFIISTVIFGVILLIMAVSLVITELQIQRSDEQEDLAFNVERSASELGYLSNDYLLFHESQQRARWESKLASFSNYLARLNPDKPEQQAVVNNIKANQQRLEAVFTDVATALEGASRGQDAGAVQTLIEVSWSRMAVQNQAIFFEALRLSQMLHEDQDQLRQTRGTLIIVLLGVFGAFVFAGYVLNYRRIINSLSALRAGTRVIGSGDLDFAIPVKRNDEIGELSRAFNRMTANLKDVTASKAALEGEIAERTRAEDGANRQKAVQEGINRILEAALTCDTEEELGRTCLAVAEQLTGSKFGFIGEVNPKGRLDDIAISDPGWEACRTETPVGHGKLPHDLDAHGIYGRVLLDGKAFFTNDPSAHPDRIGTPEGHPPLTAFLGFSLTGGGKTIGMVGLGNRDGGYRAEDQEAAESLAPAIVEALERKRAEEEIKQLNESLLRRAAELEVSNKELEAFSYSVSHDLRAPLRHIDGFSRVLLEDYQNSLDEAGKHHLERLRAASQRMGQLIDDMLKLSRITRAEIRHESVDLSRLARKVTGELQQAEPGRRVELALREGIIGRGDPRLLQVVLENLLANAWKFSSKRAVAKIEFGVAHNDDRPVYYVKDNGVGFDMAYVSKLFGAFQRLHRSEEFPGTGIGLATVQRIIHRHGGRVWAEGEVDRGATLYFTL